MDFPFIGGRVKPDVLTENIARNLNLRACLGIKFGESDEFAVTLSEYLPKRANW